MSYLKKIEYKIVPTESFTVVRGCSGCGTKTHFINTKKFRVNANGNKLDVWLIYQCENCKHTLNLAIYERQKVSSIPKEEYKCFLSNEEHTAEQYGKNIHLFQKNKVEIDFERLHYQVISLDHTTEISDCHGQMAVVIHNPYELKIRPEKQIAVVLGLSRSQVQKMMREGIITLEQVSSQMISIYFATAD